MPGDGYAGASEGFVIGQAERIDAVPEVFLECAIEVILRFGEHGRQVHVAPGLARDGEVGRHHWGGWVVGAIWLVVTLVVLVVVGLIRAEVGWSSRAVRGQWGVAGMSAIVGGGWQGRGARCRETAGGC